MPDTRISHEDGLAVSLNALRAFESAARHLSFTVAAKELSVTQAAVSHQVKALEDRLGVRLFRRTPRGLVITDEGLALAPTLSDAFNRIERLVSDFRGGQRREPLTVGVVGTFALGWLLPRLSVFEEVYPFVDLRLLTHNNKVDVAGESLDFAIRFGDGAWHGLSADHLLDAPISPMCSPSLARRLEAPQDLQGVALLRSYRSQDWPIWLEAVGIGHLKVRGPLFDSSSLMAEAASRGHGVALVPPVMFSRELASETLVQPFPTGVDVGSYWLTRLKARSETDASRAFRDWITSAASSSP